jgi:catechol 2,3-dioxygenase-like lactoylglutathione lyase family enzyme
MIHIHLTVRDLERSVRFYREAFGLKEILRHEEDRMVFLQTPGTSEVVTLREEQSERVGSCGGIDHFGFPLVDASELDRAIAEVEAAGGRLIEKHSLAGGYPTAFVADPDGYRIQI